MYLEILYCVHFIHCITWTNITKLLKFKFVSDRRNTAKQSPWDYDSFRLVKNIPCALWNPKGNYHVHRARHLPVSRARSVQSAPSEPISLRCVFPKVKVKCTLVQALRLCTGRTAHRGSRGIALPFHYHGTRRGWGVQRHAPAALYSGERPGTRCTGGWVGPRAGLDRCGKSRPQRDSIPGPSSP